jgi:hypothetical protein
LHVVGDAALDHRAQLLCDRKEPIRRAEVTERLVRPAVVVVLDPRLHPLLRLLEAVELRAGKEVRPDRLPEPLDLTQGLRVMRGAAEVMDTVFLKLRFKPRLPAPVGVLPAIVRQHLLGQAILAHRPPIHFQHVLGGLTAIEPQPDQVAGVIVHEPNQIGVLTAEANRANVALPHLIGRRPLEEPRLGRILDRLAPVRLDQLLLVQHAPHGLATDRQQPPPTQPLADLLHTKAWLLLLQGGDMLAHRRG